MRNLEAGESVLKTQPSPLRRLALWRGRTSASVGEPRDGRVTMNAKRAAELLEAWGDKPCDHPLVEKVGAHTGLEACGQCGRMVTRDSRGRPIPHAGPSAPGPSQPAQI